MDRGSEVAAAVSGARDAHRRRQYDAVYRALQPLADHPDLAADDLVLLADAAWWLGRAGEVLELCEALHHRYLDEGRIDRAAYHAVDIAGMLFMAGRHGPAMGWLNRGQRLLEDLPPCAAHGVLTYVSASEALAAQQLDTAAAGARDLDQLGRSLGDQTFCALALLVDGLVDIRRGNLARGFGELDEAMLPILAGTVAPDWAGHIYCTIVSTCLDLADLPRAREWADATERWVAEASDAVMFVGVCRAHRLQLLVAEGAWPGAEAEAGRVVHELAELNQGAVAEAEYQLAETFRIRGDRDGARVHYARASDLGRDPQPGAALLALSGGDGAAAWSQICAAVADDIEPFGCARMLRAQVEIGIATGHLDTLDAAVRRLADLRDTYATPGFTAWADEAAGVVLLARGHAAEALPLLRRAAAGHHRIGARLDRAAVELRIAAAHRVLGDRVASQSCEETARALFEQLGVDAPPIAHADQTVRPGGLSAREVEVLRTVATGASNKAAAATLHITEATLRRHLANIFAKLGVASRTAAAAWAHEHGLSDGRVSG